MARFEGGDDGGVLGEGGTAEAWLEKAKPRVLLRPAAKLCVEKALAFLPKLKEGLAARVRAQETDSDDDELDDLFEQCRSTVSAVL